MKGIIARHILKDNIASMKIAEKLGMTLLKNHQDTVDYIIYK
ncbi:GNAT family N-acetyltransferase [Bacillus massilioanorexius]|nr:GNAT family N-acetyltransferase [Bacillus massilioanorexius]